MHGDMGQGTRTRLSASRGIWQRGLTLAHTTIWGGPDGTVCVQNSKVLLQSAIPGSSEVFAAALVRF